MMSSFPPRSYSGSGQACTGEYEANGISRFARATELPAPRHHLHAMQMLGGLILLTAIRIVVRSTAPKTGKELAESAVETDAP